MGVIINEPKHYLTRFVVWVMLIALLSIAPFLIGLSGAWLIEYFSGQPCHEGNCAWAAIPWMGLITIPVGMIAFVGLCVIVIIDSIVLRRNKN